MENYIKSTIEENEVHLALHDHGTLTMVDGVNLAIDSNLNSTTIDHTAKLFMNHNVDPTTYNGVNLTIDDCVTSTIDNNKKTVEMCVVCVTGAGGFIASWLVKRLLEKGHIVKGTLRNPDDPKNSHLMQLEGATERLVLIKASLLDLDNLLIAFEGCDAIFHLASPMTDDPEDMLDPAVKGTLNVIDAAAKSSVKRVIYTSSIGTVYMDPKRDPSKIVDESCWSDLDFCKDTKNWYCYGKTVAEQAAWNHAQEKNIDLVVLVPSLVLGPLLQPTMNASTLHVVKYLTGSTKTYANSIQAYVDVRDVVDACILLYETPSSNGRYLCAESVVHRGDVCGLLGDLFPKYPIPRVCSDEKTPRVKPYLFCNEKLRRLGLSFTPLKKCLHDTVVSLQEKGFIN